MNSIQLFRVFFMILKIWVMSQPFVLLTLYTLHDLKGECTDPMKSQLLHMVWTSASPL